MIRILWFTLIAIDHNFLISHASSKVFTKRGANRIGKIYKKAIYREFTDGSFVKMFW